MDHLDDRILSALRAYGGDPRVAGAARALSWAGEHGALWLAAGFAGAAVDGARRGAWLRGTALTAGAHLVSMGVKRVVRRPRPAHVVPLVRTAGRHSFPSSHAASATAAAVAFGMLGARAARRTPGASITRRPHNRPRASRRLSRHAPGGPARPTRPAHSPTPRATPSVTRPAQLTHPAGPPRR
ncbi:phosphatase PAP2 family protein [Streptomyces sp. FZ201]|uniref:phosphatase PAP2 family protein n=1 Tax=Streptomyces sp. FZ201 TaxID=3057122 RepID=UPI0021C105B1|nr:phosphatase PAP2 family protein [Streptomyces sp. FZ201]